MKYETFNVYAKLVNALNVLKLGLVFFEQMPPPMIDNHSKWNKSAYLHTMCNCNTDQCLFGQNHNRSVVLDVN